MNDTAPQLIVRMKNGLAIKFHPPSTRLIYEVATDAEATTFDNLADATCRALNYGLRFGTFTVEQITLHHGGTTNAAVVSRESLKGVSSASPNATLKLRPAAVVALSTTK